MPSSFTMRFRFEMQFTGENVTTWGERLNALFQRIDEALGDETHLAITGNVALTVANLIADQARSAVLKLTGAPGATFKVTIPGVEKIYLVKNETGIAQTIGTSGGVAATVRAGQRSWVQCDGTDTVVVDPTLDTIRAPAAAVAMGGQKITGLATPTADTDAATKAYADAGDAGVSAATAADRQATATDRVQTGLDRQATAADRVQTGLDRAAAAQSAANAAQFDPTAINARIEAVEADAEIALYAAYRFNAMNFV